MGFQFSLHNLRSFFKQSALSLGVLLALSVTLTLLAALQYRWSGEVSEAERDRLKRSLNAVARQFQREFHRELVRVCATFQTEPGGWSRASINEYIQRYKDWEQTATHPRLVANLFLWKLGGNGNSQLLRLNQASLQFEPAAWPPKFAELRERLTVGGRPDPSRTGNPGAPPFAWRMAEEIPALVHPLFQLPPPAGGPSPSEPRHRGFVVVELNLDYLQTEFFPSLIQRFFGGASDSPYQVTVVSRSQLPKVIYPPNLPGAGKEFLSGDVVVDLLAAPLGGPFSPRPPGQVDESERNRGERAWLAEPEVGIARDFLPRPRRFRPTFLLSGAPVGRWQLIVKHRSGSLEAVVAAGRRRNLGISFGILLLLAVSAVMVVISTMRARNLARLQMEFVAGVSHELRTPLAVICSAADNLATGIVNAKDQVQRYGELIRSEGSRLSRMVQQILLFASNQAGCAGYELRPVQLAEIVESVLADSTHMIEAAGFSTERQIEPDLPLVLADPNALGQCLQNLVSNAVKYGGEHRWIGIRARKMDGTRGSEVQVIVEDKGLGIAPAETKDIFKPFYRSRSAAAAQIHGTGLGLSLAKSIAEAMGGSLSVESTPGKGSAFMLCLPALKQVEQPQPEQIRS
jgi:signal transduction histidine kinase/type II secretory pathway pseudopilin PulG